VVLPIVSICVVSEFHRLVVVIILAANIFLITRLNNIPDKILVVSMSISGAWQPVKS
jgi:hypothetical protein